MSEQNKSVTVIGHKNPDTDSICSAIAYATLKSALDPGADYHAGRSGQGSVALSYETVFAEGHDADVWIVKYGRSVPYTYASLVQDFPSYAAFRPWKERRIFGCNTYEIPFYEEVPFHPDRLLRDMVEVLHPGLLPGHALRYYRPLAAGE